MLVSQRQDRAQFPLHTYTHADPNLLSASLNDGIVCYLRFKP